ncbi:glycosyltransferase [Halomonas aquatica]|uniref:Glycosyltransferase n=1 Tax=Halomonas aquatica TaxID=3151123 RepID=A0ABV1NAV1_9GAMM
MPDRFSIIVSTLNEAATIEALLTRLRELQASGVEILVMDDGSLDDTVVRARPLASRVLVRSSGDASMSGWRLACLDRPGCRPARGP